jgi:hypothetical protein
MSIQFGLNNDWKQEVYPKTFGVLDFYFVKSEVSILFEFIILGLGFYVGLNWGKK